MNKKALIQRLSADTGLPQRDCEAVLVAATGYLIDSLENGQDATLHGLGKLQPYQRAARRGRNPGTGEVIDIPAKTAIKFKPAKALLEAIQ